LPKKLRNLEHCVFDYIYQEFQNKVYVQVVPGKWLCSFYNTRKHTVESENSFNVTFALSRERKIEGII